MAAATMEEKPQEEDVTELVRKRFFNGPIMQSYQTHSTPQFHMRWRETVSITSATASRSDPANLSTRIVFRFPVIHEYLNPGNTLHGAAQTLFYDIGMAYLLTPIMRKGFWDNFGFSRSLAVKYVRTAKVGEVVLMDVETVHVGARMALLKGEMRRERDGKVISTCEHDKFTTGADGAKL